MRSTRPEARGVRAWALALALAAALAPGCVSRRMYLRSEPPGAHVWLDGQLAGVTPHEEDIPAWGTRHARLELDGHAPAEMDLVLDTPWWDHWPLDMLAAAWPWTIRVERRFDVRLQPLAPADEGWDAAERAWRAARETAARAEDG